MTSLLRYLQAHWRPSAELKTRAEIARFADEEWALLVCQQRMTDAHQETLNQWYEGTIETDVFIPSGVDSPGVNTVAPVAVPQEDSTSTSGDAPVELREDLQAREDKDETSSIADSLEGLRRLSSEIADAVSDLSLEEVEDEEAFGPHYPAGYLLNPCRALVPVSPPSFTVQGGCPPVVYCRYTQEWEDSRPPHDKLVAAVKATGSVIASYLFEHVIPLVAGTVVYSMAQLVTMVGEAERPVNPTIEGPALPMEERGAPMGYMNSAAIAMELRRRFGRPQATPANVELGGRVAREVLSDRCGATRSEAWYTSVEATKMWLSPTLVDLVQSTGQVGFCLGDVEARMGVETKVVPDIISPHMRVKLAARPRAVGRTSYFINAVRPRADFGVHNNSLNNLVRGINERVFFTDNKGTLPLTPLAGAFQQIDTSCLKSFRVQPWTMEQVVDSYTGRHRTRYQQAMESIYANPLTKRDARVATFIKAEKVNFTVKPDPAPRVIQPRDPRFNISIAKFIKPLEPLLYKQLGKLYRYPCVAKGFNALQTGEIIAKKWSLFRRPVCVGLDASRFDQHVSVEALRFTHSVYRRFIKNEEFHRLLDMMYVNRGIGTAKDGIVLYRVHGNRMSGDMDTALGNCVLMVLMTRQLCVNLNIPHELMDNGDDCVVIFEEEHLERFNGAVRGYFADLGFTMKVEPPVRTLEKLEFCQTQPVFDGSQWRMVRQVTSIAKDLNSVIQWEQLPLWWRAIGECGLALTGGIPVFDAFYKWLLRASGPEIGGIKGHPLYRCGMTNLAKGMDMSEHVITTEARMSFATAFGIVPSMQIAIENTYLTLGVPGKAKKAPVLRDEQYLFNHWFEPEKYLSALSSHPWCPRSLEDLSYAHAMGIDPPIRDYTLYT
nr:MAG: RNA-dependent RNA polymerase [Picris umbravirus 1]